jgi:hypothetical protein
MAEHFDNNKKINIKRIVALLIFLIVIAAVAITVILVNQKPTQEPGNTTENTVEEPKAPVEKVDIIDVNSKTRPLAVVVNNTPVAVKVQTGLNKAYLVYEMPTEGGTCRLMALYKDVENLKIGTIRSARHNFIDWAYESDAIFTSFGWSYYAQNQMQKQGVVDYVQGIVGEGGMYRENPENLASEHTAYLDTDKVYESAKNKGYKLETDKSVLLKYNVKDVDISEKEGAKKADKVVISYDGSSNVTTFKYNLEAKMYERYVTSKENICKDHETGEVVSTKNIIIEKINYTTMPDGHYLELQTTGSGSGWYITNGQAVPIKWSKSDRKAKTEYKYTDGTEIEVSDGRTYIEVMPTNRTEKIESAEAAE